MMSDRSTRNDCGEKILTRSIVIQLPVNDKCDIISLGILTLLGQPTIRLRR